MEIPIAVRSSAGVSMKVGPPAYGNLSAFKTDLSKSCRAMLYSPDGRYFAWVNGRTLNLVSTADWSTVAEIPNPRTFCIGFSPKGTFLLSWEPFTVSNAAPQGTPNLHLFKTEDGTLVKSFIHKKQTNWEPMWSGDEHLCARIVNTDVIFYESSNFERIQKRINCCKVASFSLSPSLNPYYVLCHSPGANGQPAFGRLFLYPNLELSQAVANKSFFQADKVEVYWNAKGSNAVMLTMTEVDKTGGSYYGKQTLHSVGINGETCLVQLSKGGPIYDISWSPKNQEFCVIYGFMPAKTTVFNLKCEPVFEVGTGPRNALYYNPHGNFLLIAGFGNLRGQIEVWDMGNHGQGQRKMIAKCDAPDTTLLQWSPDGTHFMTATTAPRLRIGNGFKIWHCTGSLLHETVWPEGEELYEVRWKTFLKGAFKEPVVDAGTRVEGIVSAVPQASKEAYRPPSARNRPAVAFKLHDEEEKGSGQDQTPSKAALKMRKKREARKARKQEEGEEEEEKGPEKKGSGGGGIAVQLTGDAEKDKKIKNVKKRLDAISKLKEQRDQGKALEVNQLAKIKGEDDLLKELQQLQL